MPRLAQQLQRLIELQGAEHGSVGGRGTCHWKGLGWVRLSRRWVRFASIGRRV
jgi:hypothetical protein